MDRIASAFLLIVFPALACAEPEEEAPVCEVDQDYAYAAGDLWGPCRRVTARNGMLEEATCDRGGCWAAFPDGSLQGGGDMCILGNCAAVYPSPWCGETVDGVTGGCLPICETAADCVGGMICTGTVYKACVWPRTDAPDEP